MFYNLIVISIPRIDISRGHVAVHSLSNAEKRKMCQSAFAHYGFSISNNEIVKHCNYMISSTFVGKMRKMIEAEQKIVGAQPDKQRVVKRNNSIYPMKTNKIGMKKNARIVASVPIVDSDCVTLEQVSQRLAILESILVDIRQLLKHG